MLTGCGLACLSVVGEQLGCCCGGGGLEGAAHACGITFFAGSWALNNNPVQCAVTMHDDGVLPQFACLVCLSHAALVRIPAGLIQQEGGRWQFFVGMLGARGSFERGCCVPPV